MTNLEQTVEKSFLGKVRNNAAGKVALYTLAGALGGGLGYGCGEDEFSQPKNIGETYVDQKSSSSDTFSQPKDIQENGEEPQAACLDKTFGEKHTNAKSIQQVTGGGYIVAGEIQNSHNGEFDDDVWIFKLNLDGSLVWDKTFEGSEYENVSSIQQTTDGGYVVASNTSSKGAGSWDAWILKLNSNGNAIWDKTFGG